ncbi:UDP-galactopyranose mutase, FAD/NAD(P)-binding [Escherichia coli]|uniref:UDP-galactopyranose mutase, FAD/NAD(P)-binding n=1 Tax=Escherichia coli TaxID=562 RepID=A0A376P8C9_ECOLX|nr:UDP-galactopyranose mutase, FAD/NAD(P)-binding [Escherichia coli]
MNTFNQLWGAITPQHAKEIIKKQSGEISGNKPRNLEEQAISLVGRDIYNCLIKEYTEKQWGRPCTELPSFIINDSLLGLHTIITILMTSIKEYQSVVTIN